MNTITLQLTEAELGALGGLIDAGVRAAGLRAVKDAANLVAKIEAATEEASKSNVVELPPKEKANG